MQKKSIRIKGALKKLITCEAKCTTVAEKQHFISLGIAVIVWLTANYTLDLTEDILLYTQTFNSRDYSEESFKNIIRLLKIANNKLDLEN